MRTDFLRNIGGTVWRIVAIITTLIVVGIIITALTAGFPLDKTPQGKVTVLVGGGFFEANTVEGIKTPDDGVYFKGWYDHAYDYPITQRSYVTSVSDRSSDAAPQNGVVPAKDGVQMQFETAAYFKLNPDLVGDFHNNIGIRTEAWTERGWERMMSQYFGKVEQDTIRSFARRYTVDQLYCPQCLDESASEFDDFFSEAERQIGQQLRENLERVQGAQYFCGPDSTPGNCTDIEFVINNVKPAADNVTQKYAQLRTSGTEIEIQQNNVKASRLQAQAARALTKKGTLTDDYVRLRYVEALQRAIESGNIQFWVLNGQNVTVPGGQPPTGDGG